MACFIPSEPFKAEIAVLQKGKTQLRRAFHIKTLNIRINYHDINLMFALVNDGKQISFHMGDTLQVFHTLERFMFNHVHFL